MSSRPRQSQQVWLGTAIVAVIALLGAAIFLLDDILSRLRSTYTVVAVVEQAPGLVPGSRVWVSGKDVGEVSSVGFLPMQDDSIASIALNLELPTSVRPQLRRDSEVRVTSDGLVGQPVIDLSTGSATAPPLQEGDTVRQREALDAAALTARATNVRLALDSALQQFRSLQPALERRMSGMQRVQANVSGAQREYQALLDDLRRNPGIALLQGGQLQGAVARSRSTLTELLNAIDGAREKADRSGLSANARELGESAVRLRQTLAALEASLQAHGGGTLARFQSDSALIRAIATAKADLDSLIADAKRHPMRYVF